MSCLKDLVVIIFCLTIKTELFKYNLSDKFQPFSYTFFSQTINIMEESLNSPLQSLSQSNTLLQMKLLMPSINIPLVNLV